MKIEDLRLLFVEYNLPENFEFKKDANSLTLFVNTSNKVDEIIFGWIKTANGFYIRKPVLKIKIKNVESMIFAFNREYPFSTFYSDSTIHAIPKYDNEFGYSFCEQEIVSKEDYFAVSNDINKFYEIVAIPFFEKFGTVQEVFEEVEDMPIEKMASFIVQPLPQRRMVIKKLCNDINYSDYVNMVIDYYKSENDESWREIEQLDSFLRSQLG